MPSLQSGAKLAGPNHGPGLCRHIAFSSDNVFCSALAVFITGRMTRLLSGRARGLPLSYRIWMKDRIAMEEEDW